MKHKQSTAERAGAAPAGDASSITVMPLYGSSGSWRELHGPRFQFHSDASLRVHVDDHRQEFIAAGALARYKNRLFAIEPLFSATVLRLGREAVGYRHEQRVQSLRADAAEVALRVQLNSAA